MMATTGQQGVKGVRSVTRAEAQDLPPFISVHNRFQELSFRGATGGRLVFAHHSILHSDK